MKLTSSLFVLLSIALVACAAESANTTTTSATLPAANANGEYSPNWPTFGKGVDRFVTLHLGPDTLAQCRMVSPKFPFNSAVAYVEDQDQLAALARCLNYETMQSRGVLLVGHTDRRGGDAYNTELGMQRAEQIRAVLIREGLTPSRIVSTISDGERDARANGEYSSGYDRRVDVIITGGVHQQ